MQSGVDLSKNLVKGSSRPSKAFLRYGIVWRGMSTVASACSGSLSTWGRGSSISSTKGCKFVGSLGRRLMFLGVEMKEIVTLLSYEFGKLEKWAYVTKSKPRKNNSVKLHWLTCHGGSGV